MGSWWRTMRIRQTKLPAVRSWLRELPGTAQVFAKPGEPVPASSLLLRATRRTLCHRGTTDYPPRRASYGYHRWVVGRLGQMPWRFAETPYNFRHLAFGIFQTIPTESSPQTISPGDRFCDRSTPHHPVMDGHGNWSAPDNN